MATIADLARSLTARVPQMSSRLVDAVYDLDDVYRERHLVPPADLWRSVHDNLLEGVAAIGMLAGEGEFPMSAAHATGQRRAEQGLPLESLLHAYRLGGVVLWEAMLEEARSRTPAPIDDLMEGAVLVWEIIDLHSSAAAQSYRRTQARMLSRNETERQTFLNGLLTGMVAEGDLAFAAEVLDLPETGLYLVAVTDLEGEAQGAVGAALTAQGIRSEWLLRQDRLVGLIAPRSASPGAVRGSLRAAAGARMGLSPPVGALGQLAGAYRQAELALRSIPPHALEVASLDERLTGALLAASPELARRLADRVLGALFELAPADREVLLRTLRGYVELGGSVAAVARAVPCHRNTVLNRIGRIQDLTGLSPSNPREMTQLALALEAMELLSIEPERP
ncbi:MAG: PucR family transcriptional regulator [Candidatus Dormibacteraceae bacterium]